MNFYDLKEEQKMNRQQKEIVVEGLKENLLSSPATFLVIYRGLNVEQMQQLRSDLRSKGDF